MKAIILGLLVLCTVSFHATPDTNIKVLGVRLVTGNSTTTADIGVSQLYFQRVLLNWPSAALTGGVSVTLLNGGVPLVLFTASSTTYDGLIANAEAALLATNGRNDADVVMFFTGEELPLFAGSSIIACGVANAFHWNTFGFNPPVFGGLDLTARDSDFAALVGTKGGCSSLDDLPSHEFGHLFGAGHHHTGPADLNAWLFIDSHSKIFNNGKRSIMVGSYASPFQYEHRYTAGIEATNANNMRAIFTTAKSVANYRSSGCSIVKPTNVKGFPIGCAGNGYTRHVIQWDSCTSDTDYYEVHGSQPIGSPYVYGWSTPLDFTDVYVIGAAANIKANACKFSGIIGHCTALSSSEYFAFTFLGCG